MKKLPFIILLLIFFHSAVFPQRTVPNSGIFWAPMTINNITAWYSSDGRQEASNSTLKIVGASYPRNTAPTINTSGFLFGGVRNDSSNAFTFVNGSYYSSTLRQGSILGLQTGLAENYLGPQLRIWRIRKDYTTADLRRDAAETYGIAENSISVMDVQRLRSEYKKDWKEWPGASGAPYVDVNKNGIYDPKFIYNEFGVEIPDTTSDSPGVANADQIIWYVCNDLGGNSPWGTAGIGMEMQVTVWGFNTTGAMANTLFRRCKLIYKGTSSSKPSTALSNMYVGIWSAVDLGRSTDNLAGSDSLLGLGYVYNSKTLDAEYLKYNIIPPVIGFDIVQGPVVKGSGNDSALVNFSYKKGLKNLPVTSLTYTGQSNPSFNLGASGVSQVYHSLQGYPTRENILRTDPVTQQVSKFWSTGDPVSRVGWIDGIYEPAGSRELCISSGPFSMALGDTQEIVTALIAAESPDRLGSVNVLKYYDKIVQDSYQRFVTPAPSLPKTNATFTEFDKSILLEWEKDTARLNQTERFSSRGYVFEGYNLYQLPNATASQYDWKKIATYDLKNEVTQIVQEEIDAYTGRVKLQVKQEGKNSGIIRYVILTNDELRNTSLVNGQQYYFALTSYASSGNPTALLQMIESEPQIFAVTPHQPNPETVLPYAIKDSLSDIGENFLGNNDGRVGVRILDPYSVTGGIYDFWFGISGASSTWTMVRNLPGSDYATVKTRMTTAELASSRNNPPVTTTGTASLTINDALDKITFSVEANTTANITSIEVARGPRTQNGATVKILSVNSKTASGVWTSADAVQPLTEEIIRDLAAGFLYVIVKSANYPAGEMRGQLSEGVIPRTSLPIPDFATSSRSVFSFPENRFANEGISLFVSPAPVGFRSGEQIAPSRSNIVNETNKEGTYSLIGPGIAWGGYNLSESTIDFRFTSDTNWAIVNARIPAETKFIRVPFQVYQDSVRVWPVIENAIPTDTVWDTKGNAYKTGKPTFDNIVGIVNRFDATGNDISYAALTLNGNFPTGNSIRGRLINGVNHIAKNIVFLNAKGDGLPPSSGTVIRLSPYKSIKYGDIKRISLHAIQKNNVVSARQQIQEITVFPNPYYGVNLFENSSSNKFITFSHLPQKATLRIYSLAGIHVRTLTKDDPEQFFRWDLRNEKAFFVASGLYIVYIDLGEIGIKTLKLAVIMEGQNLNTF